MIRALWGWCGKDGHLHERPLPLSAYEEGKECCGDALLSCGHPVGTWRKSARVPLSELYSRQPGFPGGSVVKNLSANAGDTGLIPRLGRSPGGGNGNPLQYSCQENPMERRAQRATICGVAKELDTTE